QDPVRQKELEEIAAARRIANENKVNEAKGTIKKDDQIGVITRTSVSSLRDKLANTLIFSNQTNTQKDQVQEDIKALQNANHNVRSKAKELEKLLTQSRKAIHLIKENKVSTQARKKLDIKEVLVFEEVQEKVIGCLETKLKEDFKNYEELMKTNLISK